MDMAILLLWLLLLLLLLVLIEAHPPLEGAISKHPNPIKRSTNAVTFSAGFPLVAMVAVTIASLA